MNTHRKYQLVLLIVLMLCSFVQIEAQSIKQLKLDRVEDSIILALIDSVFESSTSSKKYVEELKLLIKNRDLSIGLKAENKGLHEKEANCNFNITETCLRNSNYSKNDTGRIISFSNEKFVIPVQGAITSKYGYRDHRLHKGIDIDLKYGTPVFASFRGVIKTAKRDGNYGNVVIVNHDNGLETIYAHLSKIKVKQGAVVSAGDLIGLGGSTGRSSGAHLHYEIRYNGYAINPEELICFKENTLEDQEFIVKQSRSGYVAYSSKSKIHKVKKGESISKIAIKYATSIQNIQKINHLNKRANLREGQLIRVT